MPPNRERLIEQVRRGGPADGSGIHRDPRCWNCGKIVIRGSVRPPYTAGCAECDAVTVVRADGTRVQ